MAITWPVGCDTPEQRWRYIESFLEDFRLVHNVIGLWYREGITLDEYNNGINGARIGVDASITVQIPQRIKTLVPYQATLPENRWSAFVAWHSNALSRLQGEKIAMKDIAKSDHTWPHNYDEL